jgi:hypothetical protein
MAAFAGIFVQPQYALAVGLVVDPDANRSSYLWTVRVRRLGEQYAQAHRC